MRKRMNLVSIIAFILFSPVAASLPAAEAQSDLMDFVMAYPSDIWNLNPLLAGDHRSRWYTMLVYDTLLS
ncbi:MAG: hypothetical protein JSW61_01350 [Candidatus Thorarchaeota archaeon]|nr:MAG: hypothetical protein JSW61_01350 [Candidatus Thorarchaeota archaeon]